MSVQSRSKKSMLYYLDTPYSHLPSTPLTSPITPSRARRNINPRNSHPKAERPVPRGHPYSRTQAPALTPATRVPKLPLTRNLTYLLGHHTSTDACMNSGPKQCPQWPPYNVIGVRGRQLTSPCRRSSGMDKFHGVGFLDENEDKNI